MRKSLLLLVMSLMAFRLSSEDIAITFIATGAASEVTEVTAKNLATNTSIVLPGNATLILHQVATGIQILSDGSGNGIIYPNPFQGTAKLMVNIKRSQTICMQLIGPEGQVLVQNNQYLPSGNHLFTVAGSSPGIYFIRITTHEGTISYKAMCVEANGGESGFLYNGFGISDINVPGQNQLKHDGTAYLLDIKPGDIILYTCKSGNYRTVIADSPASSKTYTVEFMACTDRDSQNYGVVKIGEQWWMAENLKTTKYRNGEAIPEVTDTTEWMNQDSGAYCNYENDTNNGNIYGKLYNWFAVTDSRNITPEGWHVPDNTEWQALINFLGGSDVAGGKMKETDTTYWQSPNTGATNESAFSGLPGGLRAFNSLGFIYLGQCGYWWTSTAEQATAALFREIDYNYAGTSGGWTIRQSGLSVRCVRYK